MKLTASQESSLALDLSRIGSTEAAEVYRQDFIDAIALSMMHMAAASCLANRTADAPRASQQLQGKELTSSSHSEGMHAPPQLEDVETTRSMEMAMAGSSRPPRRDCQRHPRAGQANFADGRSV